jgi:hypothetical protein
MQVMRRGLVVFALLLAGCASSPPVEAPAEPTSPTAAPVAPERALALRLLLEARTLQGAEVGYGGDLPDEVIAYRRLVLEPDAAALFAGLLGSARPAGRIYALCGLREVDPASMPSVTRTLLEDGSPVRTLDGRSAGSTTVEALARRVLEDDDAMFRWRDELRGDRSTWQEGAPAPRPAEVDAALAGLDERVELARRADPPGDDALLDEVAEAERLRRLAVDQGALHAAAQLAALGPAIAPGLVQRLARPDALDRALAVLALADLGPWAGEAGLAATAAAVTDPSPLVREWALVALHERRDPDARAALVRALWLERQPALVEQTLGALRGHDPGPDLVDALAPVLTRSDEVQRRLAAELLVRAGPVAAGALPALTSLARVEDDAGNHALGALAGLEPQLAGATLAALLLGLADQPSRQWFVAAHLIELPPEGARRAVDVLLERAAPERAGALRTAQGGPARVIVLAKTLELSARAAVFAALVGLAHEPAGLEALEARAAAPAGDPLLRLLAARALRRHDAPALPALARLPDDRALRDELWSLLVEGDAAGALAWAGSTAATPRVREVVLRGVREWLEDAVRSWGLDEWRAAIALLRRWDTAESREALREIARTAEDPEVRALARE